MIDMSTHSFYGLTDVGRVRTNNEDTLSFNDELGVMVLADGMGGYNAGEVASGMAVAFVSTELARWLLEARHRLSPTHISHGIRWCIDRANQSIVNTASNNQQYYGMGTTLVVGVFHEDCLILGHVGDSRCYRLRAGELTQLTRDHSLLQEQIDAGILTVEEAATAPGKNLLTRALGAEGPVQVEIHEHRIQEGDVYLMCSDGLTDMLSDALISDTLKMHEFLPDMATELVNRANLAGGRDNIAVLLARANLLAPTPGSGLHSLDAA
jgi:protein phosphatase